MRNFLAAGMLSIAGLVAASAQAQQGAAAEPQYALDCERAHAVSRGARGIALIVVFEGAIVCELYADGVTREQSWELASGVKSFTGVMAAAAVQDGLLELDELVADTITEWRDDERKSRITVRHLLDQSSGLAVNNRARRVPDYADSIAARAVHEPGERFQYGPRHFQAFGELMRRKLETAGLDATPAHYFHRRVLAPVGATVEDWGSLRGMPILSENAAMSPLSWARFGYLVLEEGQLGEVQLVDAPTLAAMFEPSAANPVYGLSWWLPHPANATGREIRYMQGALDTMRAASTFPVLYTAAGAGGQRLYLLPELDLVVVRMTRGVREDPETYNVDWSDRRFLEALLRPVDLADQGPGDEADIGQVGQEEDGAE